MRDLSKNPAISRMTKALLIISFVLLGSMLAAPLAASNNQSHIAGIIQALPTSAPFDHIVTILMENQGLCSIYVGCGGSATYMSKLADQNVLVRTWGTTSHPSEGNYISLIGGSNFGHTSDGYCCWGITAPNIIDRIESAGLTWNAFAEDASGSGTCSFNPPRGADHFAFLTFADMNTPARCANFLKATSSSDPEFVAAMNTATPPNYLWLTPNDCNNMHSCSIATGDSYLATLVPKILSSTEFTTTKATLLIVFDEGYTQCSNTGGTGECVYASFSGPVVKTGVQLSPAGASHYSYMSTIEAAWGLPSLTSNDAGAPNMLGAFGAICTTSCPPPPLSTSFTSSPSTPLVNAPVTFTATTMGGTAPYTISWTFGDGTSGTGASITHVYTSAQSFTVTETAKDSSSPLQTATSSKTITVHSTPPPLKTSFTVLPSSPVVNSPVTFTATTAGGTAPYTVSWNFGDGASATGATATHTYSGAQSFTVMETAKDSSAPTKTATSSQTVNVQTQIKPPLLSVPTNQTITVGLWVNFTITASDLTAGKVITLSATGLPPGARFDPSTGRFSWRPSSGQTGYYTIVFTATDSSTPPISSARPVGIQVDNAAPGGSGGGSGGSGGSNGGCLLCGIVPHISTNTWLLVISGLIGLVASLGLATIKARADLVRTKRRMKQLNR